MSILNKIREKIFYAVDKVSGGDIHYNVLEIKKILDGSGLNEDQLKRILNHAIESVPFYKNQCKESLINEFQVINKSIIKENVESFLAESLKKENLFSLTTSGSTGTPFTVFQDSSKKKRNTADTIVFAEKAGYKIGEKLYYLKIWSEANQKNILTKWMQNIETIDVLQLSDKRISKLLVNFQNEKSPFGVIGYASALETLCRYCEKTGLTNLDTKINSMISISESLSTEVKKQLSSFFGIPVLARYSNVENGILGQHRNDGTDEFELNHASYFFEILDLDTDKNLPDGEIGRIVITDLYNYAMPMIRYDTGDIGCIIKSEISGKRVLTRLEGRKLDVLYNTNNQLVSSLLVYKNMWKYKEIDQYQLIQKGPKKYRLKISSLKGFKRNEEIINEYKMYLGNDAVIEIEIVNEIPLLASGKRRKVVQEYYL